MNEKQKKNTTRPLREDEKEYVLSKLNKQAYKVGLKKTILLIVFLFILCILINVIGWLMTRDIDVMWLGLILFGLLSILIIVVMLGTRIKVKKAISLIGQNEVRVQDAVCEKKATVLTRGRSSVTILQTNEYKIGSSDYVEYDHLKKGDRAILLWVPGYKIILKGIEE